MKEKLLFSPWMKELDGKTIGDIGIPSIVLMENASRGAAEFFAAEFPVGQYRNVVVLVGKGNNGGDGIAVGRILAQRGYEVLFVFLADPETLNTDPKINFDIIKNLQLKYLYIKEADDLKPILQRYHHQDTLLIDAIFGIGINKPLERGFYADLIKLVNETPLKVAAIDIPSGLSDVFLPEQGIHINAAATATFQCLKWAHIAPDGNRFCGKIKVVDIGIPQKLLQDEKYYMELIFPDCFSDLFKRRSIDAHKGNYGHSLTICGSLEKPGAGVLSSYAILKAGAGLCTAAVLPENRTVAVQSYPELMTLVYRDNSELPGRFGEFSCVLAGPGLGNHQSTLDMMSLVIRNARVPVVLDADALNVLAGHQEILQEKRDFPVVVTPHPGEFARLTAQPMAEIRLRRVETARDFAREFNVYLVLKGHHTLVVTPEGKVFVNQTGNPGMATAGSGDVLSGIITGFISQFYPAHNLAVILAAAVFVHGLAGDLAAAETGQMGLTATDILRCLPAATAKLDEFNTPFPFS